MMLTMPKFMENKDWYYNDESQKLWKDYEMSCHRLTDKAPKEAIESYLEYCTTLYNYELGYVPKFVTEDYRKFIAKYK